jgi:methionyl-tRNA formyltransferase
LPVEGRLILFALTGLGNAVLERLAAEGLAPDLLVTRAEPGPYPYEALPFIGEVASRLGIPHKLDVAGESDVVARGASLLLAATYHRRIGARVRNACGAAINLHPSLLPRNRGPNPFFWAIHNGDRMTGVTAHALTEGLDDGAICGQAKLPIAADETQTSLRRKLSALAADVAVSTVKLSCVGALEFRAQDEEAATSYPRVGDALLQLDLARPADHTLRHVNALREWPLARLGELKVRRVLAVEPRSDGPPRRPGPPHALWAQVADAEILFELDATPGAGN